MGSQCSTQNRRSPQPGESPTDTVQAAVHCKCRNNAYLNGPDRYHVTSDSVTWKIADPAYDAAVVDYTSPLVLGGPVWADPADNLDAIPFNAIDRKVNRKSHEGPYEIEPTTHRPRNPHGRTGLRGRGLLGRWGPNHAVDPIVTRWKRGADGTILHDEQGLRVVEFVAVKRKDNGEWALPGGMVDVGEHMSMTLKREFGEEALATMEATPAQRAAIEAAVEELFRDGVKIYAGYVDDPRNTDNAWMETLAMNFHDESGQGLAAFELQGGDDASHASWTTVEPGLKLYASHEQFIAMTVARLHQLYTQ
eukprot:m.199020 g.199020  ORF g.199020 m.199020 type:complete len:307 (+) comp18382_c0_seq10:705-1625(+)